MRLKEIIIHKAFREINGYKSIPETNDTYVKLPKHKKELINSGTPACKLARIK